jgi:hypothetical protein
MRSHRGLRFEALEDRLCLSTVSILDTPELDSSTWAAASSPAILADQSAPAVQPLDPLNIIGNTGEKPQSKVWSHDGHWWTVMADSQGTALWRLDGDSWTRLLSLSTTRFRADVKVVGDLAHVLLEKDSSSRLVTLEYLSATDSYGFWSVHPGLVALPFVGATETATLEVDSTGRMWIAFDTTNEIRVIHSQGSYTSWSQPFTIASGVSSDDISTIIAMPGGQIGVLWSNQNTERFGFRVHDDGAAPDVWSADELPASQSALDIGGGMADDHLNIVAAADGTLYAAVKTSYDAPAQPSIALLVRRPDGQWDGLYSVDNNGTRGIVELSESQNRLLVVYRDTNGSGPIVYRESPLDTISFGPEVVLLSGANLNNPSSVKHGFDNELVIIASGDDVLHGAILEFAPPANLAPQVNAGADAESLLSEVLQLDGTVNDDGLPDPPGALSTLWTLVSGPAAVSFADAAAVDTTVSFTQTGTYVLRLSATDGELASDDEITIQVNDEPPPQPVTISFRQEVLPTTGYLGMTDAKIRKGSPSTNFGDEKTILVDGAKPAAGLLRWDLSTLPANSQVTQVQLTFNITDASVEQFEIYEALRPWVESEVTWNQAAAGVPWGTPGASGAGDRGTAVLGALSAANAGDVTITLNSQGMAVVQAWISGTSANHGFIIQDYLATSSLAFRTSEASKLVRPILTITYLPGQAEDSAAPSAAARSQPDAASEFAIVAAAPVPVHRAEGKTVNQAQSPQPAVSQWLPKDRAFQLFAREYKLPPSKPSGRHAEAASLDFVLGDLFEQQAGRGLGEELSP